MRALHHQQKAPPVCPGREHRVHGRHKPWRKGCTDSVRGVTARRGQGLVALHRTGPPRRRGSTSWPRPAARDRSERHEAPGGLARGCSGTSQDGAKGRRGPVPHVRGRREPSRSQWWGARGRTRAVVATLSVEREAGGMAHRASAEAREPALGPRVRSKSAISALTDRLAHADEACRPRARSGADIASRCLATVDAALRRWGEPHRRLVSGGSVWTGRNGWWSCSSAHSASDDSGLAVLCALGTRGLQPPGTSTTDGAAGLSKAIDFLAARAPDAWVVA